MKRYRQSLVLDETSPAGIMPWQIWHVSDGEDRVLEAGVVVEEPLEICLDGRPAAVLMRTPGLEKELAVGFCLGEGLVADLKDVALVRHCGRAVPDDLAQSDPLDVSRNRVDVTLLPGATRSGRQPDAVQLIRSGCGRTDVSALAEGLSPATSDVRLPLRILPRLLGQMTRRQAAYRAAGGIHAAAVFDVHGRTIAVCEDIGRHNAVDKAVGYCLLRGIGLHDKLLVSTGRASYDMVAKAVRLRIPVIASISSPTSLAVELAETLNCTLLGYLRGTKLNVYTHRWRIVADGAGVEEGA